MSSNVTGKDIFGTTATPERRTTEPPWPAPLQPAAYHGPLGHVVTAIAPQTEADPAAILAQVLTMFGSVIGRGPHFRVEATVHYTNLFTAIVGDTSKARKGVSRAAAARIVAAIDEPWTTRCQSSGLSSGEGLIWAIHDAVEKSQAVRERGRVVDYQIVVEHEGVADKRLLVAEAELASVLKVMNREGNILSAIVRQAWDGDTLQTMTKACPARATAPHVSVIGHITEHELRRYLTATEAANGFGNRFLWMAAKRSRELPDGGDYVDLTRHQMALGAAVTFARQVGEVRRDEAACAWWHQIYGRLSAGRPGMFGAMTARAEAQTMRLALLYALADHSDVIRLPHLRAALEVWRYARQTVAYLFGDKLGDPIADDILYSLRRVWPESLTKTEISQLFGRNRSAADLDRALELLHTHQLAAVDIDKSGAGRPIERWVSVESADHEINELHEIRDGGDGVNSSNSFNSSPPQDRKGGGNANF